jgi:hypothetical protein
VEVMPAVVADADEAETDGHEVCSAEGVSLEARVAAC